MKLPILLITCVLSITGCATLPVERSSGYAKQSDVDVVVVESSQELKSNPLSCIAVFPLTAKKSDLKGAELIRKELHAHLAPTGIRLVTLQRVDAAVKMTDNSLGDLNASVAKSIGCDTIMVGEVTEKSSRYYGVYSEVRAGANIQIIRASTGDVLWQGSHTAVIRGGGIPFGIGSFVMNSVFAGMNLYGDQEVWVVQDLARRIVLAIPDLAYRGED
jgi:hypothetical protein